MGLCIRTYFIEESVFSKKMLNKLNLQNYVIYEFLKITQKIL